MLQPAIAKAAKAATTQAATVIMIRFMNFSPSFSISKQLPSTDLVFAPTLAHWGQATHLVPSRLPSLSRYETVRLTPRMRHDRQNGLSPRLTWIPSTASVLDLRLLHPFGAASQLQTRKKPYYYTRTHCIHCKTQSNPQTTPIILQSGLRQFDSKSMLVLVKTEDRILPFRRDSRDLLNRLKP